MKLKQSGIKLILQNVKQRSYKMAKEKKVYERVETEEVGDFKFAIITGAGFKAHERNDYNSYKVTLEITEEEAERLQKIIKKFWKENQPATLPRKTEATKKKPANFDSLVYFNENTDKWSISPSSRTEFENDDGDVRKTVIGIVDADGDKLDPEIFGRFSDGTTGWVSFNLTTYDEGVSMFLNSVQLDEFVPYEGGGGDGSGNFTKKKRSGKKLDPNSMSKKEKKPKKAKKKKKHHAEDDDE